MGHFIVILFDLFKLLPDTILNIMLLLTGKNIIRKQFVDSVV